MLYGKCMFMFLCKMLAMYFVYSQIAIFRKNNTELDSKMFPVLFQTKQESLIHTKHESAVVRFYCFNQ